MGMEIKRSDSTSHITPYVPLTSSLSTLLTELPIHPFCKRRAHNCWGCEEQKAHATQQRRKINPLGIEGLISLSLDNPNNNVTNSTTATTFPLFLSLPKLCSLLSNVAIRLYPLQLQGSQFFMGDSLSQSTRSGWALTASLALRLQCQVFLH